MWIQIGSMYNLGVWAAAVVEQGPHLMLVLEGLKAHSDVFVVQSMTLVPERRCLVYSIPDLVSVKNGILWHTRRCWKVVESENKL